MHGYRSVFDEGYDDVNIVVQSIRRTRQLWIRDRARKNQGKVSARVLNNSLMLASIPSWYRLHMYTRKVDKLCPKYLGEIPNNVYPATMVTPPKAIINQKSYGLSWCNRSKVDIYVQSKCPVMTYPNPKGQKFTNAVTSRQSCNLRSSGFHSHKSMDVNVCVLIK